MSLSEKKKTNLKHSSVFISPPLLTSRYYQDGMEQLQGIDQSVNGWSKKQAKLSMPPQWGQTLSSCILIQNHLVTHESFM